MDTLSLITHLVSHSDSFAIVPEYTNIQLLDNSIHTLTYQELPKRNMAVYYLKERYMSRQLQQLLAECQNNFNSKTKTRACRQASSSLGFICVFR